MGSQSGMTIQTMYLSKGVTTHSRGAKVAEGIGDRESHGFSGNLHEAHHLQEETVHLDGVNTVHGMQTR